METYSVKTVSKYSVPPDPSEMAYLGFEPWQIASVQRLPVDIQWVVYEEFIRRLMSGEETDALEF